MKGDTRKSTAKARELKKLAGMIRDEEHLNRIVQGCREGFRSAVKRQLKPYLTFTLAEDLQEEKCQ